MMKAFRFFNLVCLTAAMGFLGSCSEVREKDIQVSENKENRGIYAMTETNNTDGQNENPDVAETNRLLDDKFRNDYSIIYITQDSDKIQPDFSDETSDNFYSYLYYDNPGAWWGSNVEGEENIGGYNFAPLGQRELDWDLIEENGKLSSGYVFCSLYYPGDNKIRFNVEQDQSTLEGLRNSNVLGAKHSTAQARSRLRFRFYHLMVYLKVVLYVPVWREEDNSGYLENAVRDGIALGIRRNFQVEWGSNSGADASPLTQATDGTDEDDILMYLHPESEITEINVSDYYDPGDGNEMEQVRKYTFSVLFPVNQRMQNGPGIDFLRFHLQTPGGTMKSYLFSTSQLSTQDNNRQLLLERGKISVLQLYLPRKENNTILLKTYIEDWHNTSSEMNVFEEK